jgi:hypothetical protein
VPVVTRMSNVVVLPLSSYANGTRNFGPIDVASDVTAILFNVQRCTSLDLTVWPNSTTTLEIIPEISVDGGVTYVEAGRTTNAGGIQIARSGGELATSQSGGYLPPQIGGVARKYKVATTVAGGPIRTSMSVDVT